MNAGAHGGEIKGVLVEAHGLDRRGGTRVFANAGMGYSYRHSPKRYHSRGDRGNMRVGARAS